MTPDLDGVQSFPTALRKKTQNQTVVHLGIEDTPSNTYGKYN